jgi:uncharacterized membrane protein
MKEQQLGREGIVRLGKYIVVAFVLGFVIPRLPITPEWLRSKSEADPIVAFLSSISSGMMAFTGIVFSLLFVLLQFGATAYSPRIVDILGRNSTLYDAGGVFAGTFLYTLMALRGVGRGQDGSTSLLTTYVAFAWLLASVYMLVKLIQSLTGVTHTGVLHLLSNSGHREIDRVYPPFSEESSGRDGEPIAGFSDTPSQVVVHYGPPRYLLGLHMRRLVELAQGSRSVIRLPLAIGDPLAPGTPLMAIYGADSALPESVLRDCIEVGRERVLEGNPKYAIRLLVDIGIRALSPAINDPTTTVQTLDHLEALLLDLGNSKLEVGTVRDEAGQPRLVYDATSWADYLELALTETQQLGLKAPQVTRRIDALLEFLHENVPSVRRPALELWMERHRLAVESVAPPSLLPRPGFADRQGLGHTTQ